MPELVTLPQTMPVDTPCGHVAHRGEVSVDGKCAAGGRAGDALPDTAPVNVSVAPATVPVAVSAAQETALEASTPVVNTSVQFTSFAQQLVAAHVALRGEPVQRGRARKGQQVRKPSRRPTLPRRRWP